MVSEPRDGYSIHRGARLLYVKIQAAAFIPYRDTPARFPANAYSDSAQWHPESPGRRTGTIFDSEQIIDLRRDFFSGKPKRLAMSYIDSFHTPSKRRGPSAAAFMIAFAAAAGALFVPARSEACTRAVYLGPDGMIVTGRTMDWKEDPQSNIYLFPRGMHKKGGLGEHSVRWTSRYGSVVTAGYDIGTCDGMNERGLVANLLFLTESSYTRPNDDRPVMGLSIWTQYVLDNFATVDEAVAALSRDEFRIDAPDLPNGSRSTLHLSISDTTGNSAIFEYIEGKLIVHHGRQCQVMTNSPTYDKQITLNDYWEQIGGLVMLPGTNRATDRFVRASFYINAVEQTADPRTAVAAVFSVMRNVSVPLGISLPERPYIASTRWRTVSDQKNRVYFFESTLGPDIFWIDLKGLDFSSRAPVKKLSLTGGEIYAGNAAGEFRESEPFPFLFGV